MSKQKREAYKIKQISENKFRILKLVPCFIFWKTYELMTYEVKNRTYYYDDATTRSIYDTYYYEFDSLEKAREFIKYNSGVYHDCCDK